MFQIIIFPILAAAILLPFASAQAEAEWATLKIQATSITQGHGADSAPTYYTPDSNGLSPDEEIRTSFTSTIFAGARVLPLTEIYIDPEVSAGSGLSMTHGIAGFPNGEIYRVDTPDPKFSLSRFYLKQVMNLGGETEEIAQDQNQVKTAYASRRLTVVAGKFGLNDFFDNNSYSHDPRTQFFNWSLMDNGAWDYAADTRGYTIGLMLEYNQKDFAVRVASVMVPAEANQMAMDQRLADAHGDNIEFEYRYMADGHPGKVRLLGYVNHAHMGSYQESLATRAAGQPPDITTTRDYRVKYGVGLNLEQEITSRVGAFARLGWNDGRTETWAFTEIDSAASAGLSWKTFSDREDRLGLAFIWNELSSDHRAYLEAGGKGFIVGENGLNYAPEEIIETYYLLKFIERFAASADLQYVNHPGYNQDRAAVWVGALRLHAEL